jgi:hypothetical protein
MARHFRPRFERFQGLAAPFPADRVAEPRSGYSAHATSFPIARGAADRESISRMCFVAAAYGFPVRPFPRIGVRKLPGMTRPGAGTDQPRSRGAAIFLLSSLLFSQASEGLARFVALDPFARPYRADDVRPRASQTSGSEGAQLIPASSAREPRIRGGQRECPTDLQENVCLLARTRFEPLSGRAPALRPAAFAKPVLEPYPFEFPFVRRRRPFVGALAAPRSSDRRT